MPPRLDRGGTAALSGEIPVIVVSAKVGVDDKVNALLTGAADYVSKPFAMWELGPHCRPAWGPPGEEVPLSRL